MKLNIKTLLEGSFHCYLLFVLVVILPVRLKPWMKPSGIHQEEICPDSKSHFTSEWTLCLFCTANVCHHVYRTQPDGLFIRVSTLAERWKAGMTQLWMRATHFIIFLSFMWTIGGVSRGQGPHSGTFFLLTSSHLIIRSAHKLRGQLTSVNTEVNHSSTLVHHSKRCWYGACPIPTVM